MPQIIRDVVQDTTTTTGTGTKTLAAAAPRLRRTLGQVGAVTADTVHLKIAHQTLNEWEIGLYTYNSTGPTITAVTVLESSNAGAAVAFSAGIKDVLLVVPASQIGVPANVSTTKPTPIGADKAILLDSAASDAPKLFAFATLPVSTATQAALDAKQATLVSGTNVKTINGEPVLGSGNLIVAGGSGNVTRDEYEALAGEMQEARGDRSRLGLRLSNVSNFASPNAGGVVIGQFYDNSFQGSSSSTLASAAGRIDLAPFFTSQRLRMDQIGVAVSTLGAGAARCVVYSSDAAGFPDARLLTADILDTGTVGYRNATVDFTFDAGRQYWVGVHTAGAPTLRTINLGSAVNLGLATSAATSYASVIRRTVAYASGAPATWAFVFADLVSNITPPSIRFRAAATTPDAMRYAQWGAVPGTSQITIDIGELPGNGGSAITALEYSIDGGAAVALTGTGTGSRVVAASAGSRVTRVRAINAVGAGAWSDPKTRTVTAPVLTVPAAMVAGDWAATIGDTLVTLAVVTPPANGGSAITSYEYRRDGGTATTFTSPTNVTGLTNSTSYNFEVRAVNAIGAAAWSDVKARTPAAPSGLAVVQAPTPTAAGGSTIVQQAIAAVGSGNGLVICVVSPNSGGAPTITDGAGGTWSAVLHSYAGVDNTARFYSRANITDAPTWVRATWAGDVTSAIEVVEVSGGGSSIVADATGGAAQGTATAWTYGFTSTVASTLFMGYNHLTNGSVPTGVAPVTAFGVDANYNTMGYGIFPTAGANTAQINLADSRNGDKVWAVFRAG